MPLLELQARTALLKKPPVDPVVTPGAAPVSTSPPVPKASLQGLDLATVAAPAPPVVAGPSTRIDVARLGSVPGAVAAVQRQGAAAFPALLTAIDGIADLEARQRAFLRVLETFGSQWVPDASSRAFSNGVGSAVVVLKQRGMWEPWDLSKTEPRLQLDPEAQKKLIDDVLAPAWRKMVADTAAFAADAAAKPAANVFAGQGPALAQHVHGLTELHTLWAVLAKGFWSDRIDALPFDDSKIVEVASKAPPAERMLVAAAVVTRPAATTIADGAVPGLSMDDVGALLFAADKNAALTPLKTLLGDRLAASHPLARWEQYVAEPPPADVAGFMPRVHAAALAIAAGKLDGAGGALAGMWRGRIERLDTADVETATKAVLLAQSLAPQLPVHKSGVEWVNETLAALPPVVLVQLTLLPAPAPPTSTPTPGRVAQKPTPDPLEPVRQAAAQHLRAQPAVVVRMLDEAGSAADKRTALKVAAAFARSNHGYSLRGSDDVASAAARAINALLADPATTDVPRPLNHTGAWSSAEDSLQAVLAVGNALGNSLDAPVPLDAQVLAPLLPGRTSMELVFLASSVSSSFSRGDLRPWIGTPARAAVAAELARRFGDGSLEPHAAVLGAAFPDGAVSPADLTRWFGAQAAQGSERHAAALLAAAEAFKKSDAGVRDVLRTSFAALVDGAGPLDDKKVGELFGLAATLQKSLGGYDRALSKVVADRAPLLLVSAPFLDDKGLNDLSRKQPDAVRAMEERIAALTPAEVQTFLASAPDAGELTKRLGVTLKVFCIADNHYREPRAKDAKAIAEAALPQALARLAREGDPNNAEQRQIVLFASHALHEKFAIVVDVPADAALRFTSAGPAADALALSMDPTAPAGLREAGVRGVEQRVAAATRAAPAAAATSLRELLDGYLKLSGRGSSDAKAPADVAAWEEIVHAQLDTLADRPWKKLWATVDDAVDHTRSLPHAAGRVDAVLALLPPSREQNQALARALGAPPIPLDALQRIRAHSLERAGETVLRPQRQLLAQAILAHPEGPFAVVANLTNGPGHKDGTRKPLPPALQALWAPLTAEEKSDVVHDAFERLFTLACGTRYDTKPKDPAARERVKEALETAVFSSLRKDPDLAPLVSRLEPIFFKLPRTVQARVATAFALEPIGSDDPPGVLRRLLENAGVVAIKVAQQICEDPKIPKRFRDVLESLRDQNLEVSLLDAWSVAGGGNSVRAAANAGFTSLGKRLGTGSVKQANRMVGEDKSKQPLVLAFLKPGVKEEIEQSLDALAVDAELAPIVGRVRSMLMRELDLDKEAGAFTTMAKHLAPWPTLRVPKVLEHDRESLVREMAPGMPVSELLRTRALTAPEKRALQESYRALFCAALDDTRFVESWTSGKSGKLGFVLTDPHQGNVALDGSGNDIHVDLYDPGQFEMVDAQEAKLFVQLVVHLSQSFWGPKRGALLDDFAKLIFAATQRSQWQSARNAAPTVDAVRAKLDGAWKKAEGTLNGEKDPGAFLRAWLFAAADEGLDIPDAYFGVAKMLHTIDSQCHDLGLDDVIRDEVARLYKGQLTFKKALGTLTGKLGF